ncbi:MAG: sensor histidine kinase N-terminal domain-containing protein [Candidatus Obscuribacterales bacterium]|nr:sensor histidine kinase N-terminal domain-containing protein [Candidatus Obscuribacterales bacterium]
MSSLEGPSSESPHQASIRATLLLWLLIPLVSLCALSGLVAYRLAENFANDAYDKLLMRSAESIEARLGRNEDGVVVADLPRAAQDILRHKESAGISDRFFYQIADSYGHRLTGDSVLPLPRTTSDNTPKFRYAVVDGIRIRMYRISAQISPSPNLIWVQVAETLDGRDRFLKQIFLSIIVPQVVLVVLASMSVWLGVTYGLAPLVKLGRILKARQTLDLSPVKIEATPAELAPVMRALNELLANANHQIELQRTFIANAAHQLRTPVTALKTNIEYAERLQNADPAMLATVLEQMLEATSRVSRMVGQLLSLARTEETSTRTLEVLPVGEVINEAAEIVLPAALEREICMEFDLPERPVLVRADRGDLVEMTANLLDNAIKYTPSPGNVWVRITEEDNVVLSVEDNGPGVKDEDKGRIFERFFRVPGTTGPGSGLGLSIVSEIARRNNASVAVLDRPEGGTRIEITFVKVPG